jgi:3-phenylpropionate/trans-cinnamate dioxygenase ferredoxin reductase subunit
VRIFGPEIGEFYRDIHASHGIELMLGEGVEAFEGDGSVRRVRTASGRTVECDFVVVGVGIAPRVELAKDAGLDVDNGIVVDGRLQTSAPNVFAAGDVANAWHPWYGCRIRVEHWANALNQGPLAARAMLDEDVEYDRIPYFFSDQYEVGMEYSGYATEWDSVVFRGDRDGGEFIAFWLHDGRVVAGMNVNVWDVNEHVQALIHSRRQIDVASLTDPDTALEELLESSDTPSG